jgi:gas vesicle protein
MRPTIAFGVGAVIGAGIAMLVAPKVSEIPGNLENKVAGSIERGQAMVHEIAGQTIRVADQAKDRVQRVQDAVDAGVRAFDAGVRALKEIKGQSEKSIPISVRPA